MTFNNINTNSNVRLAQTFAQLKKNKQKALIPFITAGYPFVDITPDLMEGMCKAGANVIELGIPFSDPSADGPTIQKASDRAIAHGVTLVKVLSMVQAFRQINTQTPVVLMGYANPIERFEQQHGSFAQAAARAGVDGVLVVDQPPEECQSLEQALRQMGLDMIFLLAPTSTEQRMQAVAALARGYVYYVSIKGVTGSTALDVDAVAAKMAQIRQHVTLPVGVGFGIRDAVSAKRIAQTADAVVIGSRIIELIADEPYEKVIPVVTDFLRSVRKALDHELI